jgi:hypothetical protein
VNQIEPSDFTTTSFGEFKPLAVVPIDQSRHPAVVFGSVQTSSAMRAGDQAALAISRLSVRVIRRRTINRYAIPRSSAWCDRSANPGTAGSRRRPSRPAPRSSGIPTPASPTPRCSGYIAQTVDRISIPSMAHLNRHGDAGSAGRLSNCTIMSTAGSSPTVPERCPCLPPRCACSCPRRTISRPVPSRRAGRPSIRRTSVPTTE